MKSPRPLLLFLAASALFAQSRIAEIEFFGSKGVDVEAVRKALPVKAGDSLGPETDRQIRETVQRVTGKDATDIAHVCCDKQGGSFVYIGLAGQSSRAFALNAEPTGKTQVSPELATLSRKMDEALFAAVRSGNAAEQQPSPGYRFPKEPKFREATLAFRDYALQHEDDLYRVLESSSDGKQRAIAVDALGFANRSPRQIAALISASRDANGEVRNNSTRALLEISQAGPTAASQIPPDTFIDMLWSGVWSDRNKSSALLMMLAASRDPKLLARLRTEALDPLTEISHWDSDHAIPARMILGILADAPASKP